MLFKVPGSRGKGMRLIKVESLREYLRKNSQQEPVTT